MHVPETEIIVSQDGVVISRQTVRPGEYVVGREAGCEVPVEVELVSRRHAQLTVNYDHVLIEDLGSSNGTFINGQPVTAATRVWPNQKIQVGAATIELRRVKAEVAPDVSLAPSAATVQWLLPEELLREKKYDIGSVVAQGGMGAILDAREAAIDRRVAMKVMLDGSAPENLVRFIAEARVTGQLEHPNIVPIHELGVDENGQVFYTMKMVRGITLRKVLELLAEGTSPALKKYPLGVLLTVFQKVCDAVAFAHAHGIIHRDLKPENIMLGDFGEVLVMDWGLAKRIGEIGDRKPEKGAADAAGQSPLHLANLDPSLGGIEGTLAGAIMGTPQYMAPEQARGEIEQLDTRADVYALGAILFHLLALRPSVTGVTIMETVDKVARGKIEPLGARAALPAAATGGRTLSRPIPDSLRAVVRKAMSFDKAQRYASVAALQADIAAFQNGFATSAEQAGALKQLKLLMLRHKAVTASLAALLLISVGFVLKVLASERKATRNAEIASANENLANQNAEKARRSLAQTRIALADAAAANLDAAAMRHELDACPADLRDDSWRYLDAQVDSSVASLDASAGAIYRSVFRRAGGGAVGGEFLLSPETAPFVFAARPDTGEITRRLPVGFGGRKEIGLSPDGKELAVASSAAMEFKILDAETGEERFRFQEPEKGDITHISLSPGGERIHLLWKLPSGMELRCVDRATRAIVWRAGNVQSAYASRDGTLLAVSSAANAVRVLRAETGEVISSTEPSHAFLWGLAFNRDNTLVAAGDHFGFAAVWDVATGRRKQRFRVSNGRVTGIAFTDGGELVTLGQATADLTSQRVIQVWNLEHLVPLDTMFGSPVKGHNLALDPTGGWICAPGPVTRLWRTPLREERLRIETGNSCSFLFFFGPDHVITAHNYLHLNFWDIKSPPPVPKPLLPIRCNNGAVNKAANRGIFSHLDKQKAFAATLSEAGVPVVQHEPWELTGQSAALNDAGDEALCANVAFINHFVRGRSEPLRQFQLTGIERWKRVTFASGGRKIIGIGGGDRQAGREEDVVACWDSKTGVLLHRLDHPALLLALAVSPDGRHVAYAGTDKKVFILAADDFHPERSFRAHDKAITALAWHPSQPILATVSDDVSLKLWNPDDGCLLGRTLGLGRSILTVAFSPTGDRIAIGTADGSALIYETAALLRAHSSVAR